MDMFRGGEDQCTIPNGTLNSTRLNGTPMHLKAGHIFAHEWLHHMNASFSPKKGWGQQPIYSGEVAMKLMNASSVTNGLVTLNQGL